MLREAYFHCLLIFLLLKYALVTFGFTPRTHLTRSHGRVQGPLHAPFHGPLHGPLHGSFHASVDINKSFHSDKTAVRACSVRPASFGEPWFPRERKTNGSCNQLPDLLSLAPRPYLESSRAMLNKSQEETDIMQQIHVDMADMEGINQFENFELKNFDALCEHVIALQNRVHKLEKITQELCTSIIRCDDMILLERDLMHQGAIFTSSGRTEGLLKRSPMTLRSSVLQITNQYNMPLVERTYVWNVSKDLDP